MEGKCREVKEIMNKAREIRATVEIRRTRGWQIKQTMMTRALSFSRNQQIKGQNKPQQPEIKDRRGSGDSTEGTVAVVGYWRKREARLSLRGRGQISIRTLMKISTRTTQREPLQLGDDSRVLRVD